MPLGWPAAGAAVPLTAVTQVWLADGGLGVLLPHLPGSKDRDRVVIRESAETLSSPRHIIPVTLGST